LLNASLKRRPALSQQEEQRASSEEIPLLGGQLTSGIGRVGKTVRRSPKGNAAFVHEFVQGPELRKKPGSRKLEKCGIVFSARCCNVL
jgi:hypothetical protein